MDNNCFILDATMVAVSAATRPPTTAQYACTVGSPYSFKSRENRSPVLSGAGTPDGRSAFRQITLRIGENASNTCRNRSVIPDYLD